MPATKPLSALDAVHASRPAQISTGVLILLGSAYTRRTGIPDGGAWLAEIVVTLILLLPAILFDRLIRRHPGRTLSEILYLHLPAALACPLTLLSWLTGLAAGVYSALEFAVFAQSNTLYHTPTLLIVVFMFITALLLSRSGKRGILRYGGFLFPGAVLLITVLQGFALAYMDADNFSVGILSTGFSPDSVSQFLACTLHLGFLPFLLLPGIASLFSSVPSDSRGAGSVTLSVLISGVIAALALLADELVLSPTVAAAMDFPTYVRSSCIGIGDFFQHVEILSSFLFQVSCICVCTRALDWEAPRTILSHMRKP